MAVMPGLTPRGMEEGVLREIDTNSADLISKSAVAFVPL